MVHTIDLELESIESHNDSQTRSMSDTSGVLNYIISTIINFQEVKT